MSFAHPNCISTYSELLMSPNKTPEDAKALASHHTPVVTKGQYEVGLGYEKGKQ